MDNQDPPQLSKQPSSVIIEPESSKSWVVRHLLAEVLGIVVAGAVLAGGYFYYASHQKPVVQVPAHQEQQKDTTADWKMYTNTVFGFELKYPDGMQVVQEGSSRIDGTVLSIKYPDSKWSYAVDIAPNKNNQTLVQAFTNLYNDAKQFATPDNLDFQLKDYYVSDLTVGNMPAKELYIDHFSDVGSTMVIVVANGNIYLISGGVNKGDLDPFLATFKFTSAPRACIQVITPAKNLTTGEIKDFPTPCDVPEGWQKL